MTAFPQLRLRRLRRTPALRAAVRETTITASDLIAPFFVRPGRKERRAIASLPGHAQLSVDELLKDVDAIAKAGIGAIVLFGIPGKKDPVGSEAWSRTGVVQNAVRAVKKAFPDLIVITDLCFCEYTTHGHCGVLRKKGGRADVDNDATLRLIEKTAVSQAEAGADIVAPSGMMDGAVAAIRGALDRKGHTDAAILSYAAKFASAFYGPFREAAGSAPQSGDRRGYQMDPGNGREALREIASDLREGADFVMVKPALPYLDVLARARARFDAPLVAYHVSGEYAAVKAAAERGWIDATAAALEVLTSIKRAGADLIITYHAAELAPRLG